MTVAPTTAQLIKSLKPLCDDALDHRFKVAAEAFRKYPRTTVAERTEMMLRAAQILVQE